LRPLINSVLFILCTVQVRIQRGFRGSNPSRYTEKLLNMFSYGKSGTYINYIILNMCNLKSLPNLFFVYIPGIMTKVFLFTLRQCLNWEKLSRGAQSNDLKTAFHVRNYLTQTRGGLVPYTLHQSYIYFEYHFSAKQIFKFQI
jgi:hypothetical protein